MGYVLRIMRFLYGLFARLPPGDNLAKLHDLLKLNAPIPPSKSSKLLLVQCVEDPYYVVLFSGLVNSIRQNVPVEVELFIPRSFNAAIGVGWKAWIVRLPPVSWLLVRQWINMWESVSKKVGYRSVSFHPLWDCQDLISSWAFWRKATSISQLEKIKILGVVCGDLIIDSYLRFRPSPRVLIGDVFMLYLIWQAHRDIRRSRKYFNTIKPFLYLTTYTTYIQHGIAARVATQEGVRTFSFGNHQEITKLITEKDVFHTRNGRNYKRDLKLLEGSDKKLLQASHQLEKRLSGGVDSSTAYMRVSAYKEVLPDIDGIQNCIVVFLHDFYDSPHIYGDLVFSDFWDWISFTIEALQKAGVRFLIKPHPNQIALSDAVISELLSQFQGLEIISAAITNAQLVRAGIVCAVTVYGSVAHEMAYMGIPTIACGDNPHIAFSFCRTAKNQAEYENYLRNALNVELTNIEKALYKQEAIEFYVMHNLAADHTYIDLREALISIWLDVHVKSNEIMKIVEEFKNLQKMHGYNSIISSLIYQYPNAT